MPFRWSLRWCVIYCIIEKIRHRRRFEVWMRFWCTKRFRLSILYLMKNRVLSSALAPFITANIFRLEYLNKMVLQTVLSSILGGRNDLYRQAGPALRMLLKNWVFLTRKPYCFVATALVCLINIGSSPKIRISHGGTSISLITRFLMMLVMFCLEPTSARMCWI